MNKKDILQRFIFENAPVRGEIVHLGASFETIVSQHPYPPLIQQLLGEMLVASVLLSAIIKFKGRLTVQFQGGDKLKLLIAQCDNEFHIRGLGQWKGDFTAGELLEDLKKGVLVIIIQPESGGERYQGIVSWQGNSLAESLEGYFRDSEQLATRIWLASNEHQTAGLLLQILPGSSPIKDAMPLPDLNWEQIVYLTETLKQQELLMLDNETLLRRLYSHDNEVRLFPGEPVMFQCTCSTEKSENALLLLGREEIDEEIQGKQKIVVTCDFCSKEYAFDAVDIERIFKKGGSSSSSTQLH